ncbi:RPC1 [Enterospora canceri]|uniref:DNA-directed RNA polymerase subunit n=1 Tax=Enterospora canceri TaxID=1081671 RepID=A0A1Y1S7H9_9MICR|nr:RPC1 [Enterospora canceri]
MHKDGFNEDDLTVKISEIINSNGLLEDGMRRGVRMQTLNDDWDYVQLQVALYINSDLPGVSVPNSTGIKSLVNRIKGKGGRFRMNLSGKRVDFSGRTVISPDPNLSVEEVGMPLEMALEMTVPEKVTSLNKGRLEKLVENGPGVLEGANYVVREVEKEGNRKQIRVFLKYAKNRRLKVGDTVERHLRDGDVVLFNRQPSLHRMSIMAHRVRVGDHKTLRFNECVCNPYNADFDGDEMNIHVPQTKEAQAEAAELMSVRRNICTIRNNEPLVSPTQDFITGAYLMTKKDRFLNKSDFYGLVANLEIVGRMEVEPVIRMGAVSLYSGKQVIQAMLDLILVGSETRLNLDTKNRGLNRVLFWGGKFIMGELDKAIIGAENRKGSVVCRLLEISREACIRFINDLSRISSRFLMERGFSIGLDDVFMNEAVREKKEEIFDRTKKRLFDVVDEMEITSSLNRIREECGTVCLMNLSRSNSAVVMAECGSKGSRINVSQMVACVGQQVVSGERIRNGMDGRTLPHMVEERKETKTDESIENDIFYRGFVYNSFFSGLRANEFFFHTVSGREGLVDTAVKTAETGYMQRRLMKALEDLSVKYDGTVRNSHGEIVQFAYGGDGVDPLKWNRQNGKKDADLGIEPGSCVGAMSAQSIGEPGTQMTLKTFHFAGVASMNITQGVPRLKEIINGTHCISTPVVRLGSLTEEAVSKLRAVIQKKRMRDILVEMRREFRIVKDRVVSVIEMETSEAIDERVAERLNITRNSERKYTVKHRYSDFRENKLRDDLMNAQVAGLKECNGFFVEAESTTGLFALLVNAGVGEFLNILSIAASLELDYSTIKTNNVVEIEGVLGIEAARESIIAEIEQTMESHGIKIDQRHLQLLSDAMTVRGALLGITRFGMKNAKNSTLMLASFEQTADFLFGAAVESRTDLIRGVSESVIVGKQINKGTNEDVEIIVGE